MGKTIIKIFIFITLFVVTYLFARFLFERNWFADVSISKNIDPAIIFSTLLTSSITLFAAWYISKKIGNQRFEKDFLMKDLISIEQDISKIQNLINPGKIESQEFIDILYNIQRHSKRFSFTLKVCGRDATDLTNLNAKYKVLYYKFTDTDSQYLEVNEHNKNVLNKNVDLYLMELRKVILEINKF